LCEERKHRLNFNLIRAAVGLEVVERTAHSGCSKFSLAGLIHLTENIVAHLDVIALNTDC